jgi:hypothetical protein
VQLHAAPQHLLLVLVPVATEHAGRAHRLLRLLLLLLLLLRFGSLRQRHASGSPKRRASVAPRHHPRSGLCATRQVLCAGTSRRSGRRRSGEEDDHNISSCCAHQLGASLSLAVHPPTSLLAHVDVQLRRRLDTHTDKLVRVQQPTAAHWRRNRRRCTLAR